MHQLSVTSRVEEICRCLSTCRRSPAIGRFYRWWKHRSQWLTECWMALCHRELTARHLMQPARPLIPHPSHGLTNRLRTYPAAERKASLPGPHARTVKTIGRQRPLRWSGRTDVELSDNREKWNRPEDNGGRVADVGSLTCVVSEAGDEKTDVSCT